jgi:hypothetical protein
MLHTFQELDVGRLLEGSRDMWEVWRRVQPMKPTTRSATDVLNMFYLEHYRSQVALVSISYPIVRAARRQHTVITCKIRYSVIGLCFDDVVSSELVPRVVLLSLAQYPAFDY